MFPYASLGDSETMSWINYATPPLTFFWEIVFSESALLPLKIWREGTQGGSEHRESVGRLESEREGMVRERFGMCVDVCVNMELMVFSHIRLIEYVCF